MPCLIKVAGAWSGGLLLGPLRGLWLLYFFAVLATVRVISVCTRVWGARYQRWSRVSAGLMLLASARVQCWLNFLSLLATVRGGTSFLGPSATKKRSKENAFPQSVLSVPSVQTTAFGSRIERCSLEQRMFEPLLLANPYILTLRHQCSRARSGWPTTLCSLTLAGRVANLFSAQWSSYFEKRPRDRHLLFDITYVNIKVRMRTNMKRKLPRSPERNK
jgi:hypothetical protein